MGEVVDTAFIVVTQQAVFNGYLGMDISLIPQFQEGEREVRARNLLLWNLHIDDVHLQVENGVYFSRVCTAYKNTLRAFKATDSKQIDQSKR